MSVDGKKIVELMEKAETPKGDRRVLYYIVLCMVWQGKSK